MRIRFQADADLHGGVVRGIARIAPEIDFRSAHFIADGTPDTEMLRLAAADGRVLVSGDLRTMPKHFATFLADHTSPGLVLIPSRTNIGEAIRRLHNLWLKVAAEEMVNQIWWLTDAR